MTKIHEFFIAERNESIAFLILAATGIFFSFYFWIIINSPVYNGIGWSLIAISIFQISSGVNKFFKTKNLEKKVMSYLKSSKKSIKNVEIPRINKVAGRFKYYRYAETILIVFALILYIINDDPFWKGIGLGLIIECGILYLINFNSEYRTLEFLKFLKINF